MLLEASKIYFFAIFFPSLVFPQDKSVKREKSAFASALASSISPSLVRTSSLPSTGGVLNSTSYVAISAEYSNMLPNMSYVSNS